MPAIIADLAQVLLHFLTVWDSTTHHSKVHLTRCFILISSSHHTPAGATEGEWSITTVARQESGKALQRARTRQPPYMATSQSKDAAGGRGDGREGGLVTLSPSSLAQIVLTYVRM